MTHERNATSTIGEARPHRAVVLGAGMAGLAAAAALAPRAESVTVLDRDPLGRVDEARKGVPQGRHVHLLVPGGLQALERLLPGIGRDFERAGAQALRHAGDVSVHLGGGRVAVDRMRPEFVLMGATRPLLEGVLRERVRASGKVRLQGRRDVLGLATDANGAVVGVKVREREQGSAGWEETVPADLVVDASGRGSRTPRWLEDLGYDAPEEEDVRVDVRYATRLFRRSPASADGPRNVLVGALPGQRRGGVVMAVEGDRWIITLTGLLGERPPGELDDFLAYAASLWSDDVHRIASRAEPIGEAVVGSFPANVRRRYDRLRRLPGGLVVLGDALAAFNPTYGQGMSVAAIEAEILGRTLDRVGWECVGPAFFRDARDRIDDVWFQAIDNDLRHPEAEGPRTLRWRLLDRYARRLMPVAHGDPVVGAAFLDVIGLLAPASSLMRPRVAWRVLTGGGRGSGRATGEEESGRREVATRTGGRT